MLGGSLQGSLRPAQGAALPRAGQRRAEAEADQRTWYRTADGGARSASGPRMPDHKEKRAVARTSANRTPMQENLTNHGEKNSFHLLRSGSNTEIINLRAAARLVSRFV